jgi:hypothetical protein
MIGKLCIAAGWVVGMYLTPTSIQAQADFEAWKQQQDAAFESFLSEQDKAFLNFLNQRWDHFEGAREPDREALPKPDRMPRFEPEDEVPTDILEIDKLPMPSVSIPAPPPPIPEQDRPPVPKSEIPPPIGIQVNFFGVDVFVPETKRFPRPLRGAVEKQHIADYWAAISETPYKEALHQLQAYRQRMQLNDWGYARLVHETGEKIYPSSPNTRRLFVWFMLTKSGYMAKVGYKNNDVVLLLPTHQVLYGNSYFTVSGHQGKFYAVEFEPSDRTTVASILTYKGDYPGAARRFDMRMTQMPILGEDGLLKKLTFTHWGKNYTASVHINRFIAAFFTDYPQTAFDVYFSAPLSDRTQKELIPALKDLVQGMSEKEAANFILHFVQTAFAYQTDEAQFNREKPLFPEETLYYPASDCEDRSVLFSYLVRHVLNLDVIGLDYPSHMATAVRFNEAVPGMRVRYDGKTYVICDPTFINADIGRPIPQVQQVTPKVIWGS